MTTGKATEEYTIEFDSYELSNNTKKDETKLSTIQERVKTPVPQQI